MRIYTMILLCSICLFAASSGFAGNEKLIIQMISDDIQKTDSKQKKSTLHIYRARQFAKMKKWDEALDDYSTALELDHKGWIHLERSQFLLGMKKYELAYEDANAAKDEVPTLAADADKVIDKAVVVIRKQYEAENPETIIMNTRVDRYRKTRFDVMREQGVFAAKENMIAASNTRRTVKRKQSTAKSACAPRARS
jgi:tetratricopeptide (TPR) repeat protein